MKKKYEIRIRIAGENPMGLGTRTSAIKRRFLAVEPELEWVGYDSIKGRTGKVLRFDRDEAKYLMSMILNGRHRERQSWATEWDYLKMTACIRNTPMDVFTEPHKLTGDPTRFIKLYHAKWVNISLVDTERDGFVVHWQDLDFFQQQRLTLQD